MVSKIFVKYVAYQKTFIEKLIEKLQVVTRIFSIASGINLKYFNLLNLFLQGYKKIIEKEVMEDENIKC